MSLYGAGSFFSHLTLHSLCAEASRNIVTKFSLSRPVDVNAFRWATETKYSVASGMWFGLIGAIAIFLLCWAFVISAINGTNPTERTTEFFVKTLRLTRKEKEHYRDIVAGLEVILVYLSAYLLVASITNPYLVSNITDLVFALIFACIVGTTTFLLIFFRTRAKLRKIFVRVKEVQLAMFETEAEWLRQLQILLMSGLILLVAGAIVTPAFQMFGATSPIISGTADYRITLLAYGLVNVIMITGFFFGVWLPVFWQGHEIVECMKEYGKSLPESS